MSAPRFIGQDTNLMLVKDGQPLSQITAVASFEFTAQITTLSRGYLGETVERKDEVFKGISGQLELHDSNGEVLKLMFDIMERARSREAPRLIINAKTTIKFPATGLRGIVTLSDLKFGDLGLSVSGREEYGATRFPFECEEARLVYR